MEDSVAIARTTNPLVVASLEEVQAVEERLTAAKRSRFPRFAVQGNYDATTSQIAEPNNYASVNAMVDVDLYSFRREAEIDKLEAASRRTRLLLDRSVRDVEALVRDSHDRLRERLTAIDVAAAAARQADENLRIRQAQFDEGRATSEDLLDASELAARQKGNLATALYEAHLRRAELQQLLGEPLGEITNASVVLPQDVRQPMPLPRENRPLSIDPAIDPPIDQGDAPR